MLNKAYETGKKLLAYQLISKVLNTQLNIAIARAMSPEVYGAGNINFALLSTLILHFSREIFRKASLRSKSIPFSLSWVSVVISWGLGCSLFFVWGGDPFTRLLFVVAGMIEALSEPFCLWELMNLKAKGRVLGETLGFLVRGLVILMLADLGVQAFGWGQLAYSLIVLGSYIVTTPVMPPLEITQFEEEVVATSKALVVISILKFFLSEGEKLTITYLDIDKKEQGIYALVSNLGSIVCRLVFLPIEEITHNLFTKDLQREEAIEAIRWVFGLMWTVGLLGVCYGIHFSDLCIQLLYGSDWASIGTGSTLAVYSVYICVMAINGISEAIVFAKATQKELYLKQYWMLLLSLAFLGLTYLLSNLGAQGMIYSNIVVMSLRIALSWKYLHEHFKLPAKRLLPPPPAFLSTLFSFVVLHLVKGFFSNLGFAVCGFLLLGVNLLVILKLQKGLLKPKQVKVD